MPSRLTALATIGVAALGLAACQDPNAPTRAVPRESPVADAQAAELIPGHYIVVFKPAVRDVPGLARALTAPQGSAPRFVYTHALKGFAAPLSPRAAEALARHPSVAHIEQDQVVRAATDQTISSRGLWGLDRIDQRTLPLDNRYSYLGTGAGVRVYIIDTGIDVGHVQFAGRVSNAHDVLGGSGDDCNGHGTHVAGTVGGTTYGVAKQVMLRGVRVLDCQGNGSVSGLIAGVDWVRTNHIQPAVANLSLGAGYSTALNSAVVSLSNSGVFVAVAAGNSNRDACTVSPASAGYGTAVLTTAASDRTDTRASFSNYGRCVDGYAPGAGITSAWIGLGTTESKTANGTSMASPHVAGVAALIKEGNPSASSASVATTLTSAMTADRIRSNRKGTPNRLLHKSTW